MRNFFKQLQAVINNFRVRFPGFESANKAKTALTRITFIRYSLSPKYAIADFVGKLKGAASHWVTHVLKYPGEFDWQRGYGVVSFGSKHLSLVIKYVRSQKEHHQRKTAIDVLENWSEDEDGVVMYWEGSRKNG